ncbi:MAG: hypothetical protein J0L87_02365 [Bacteroidetes bacterium]|nr:hypothetical protein [Bacteroidota bacterium]
MKETKHIRSFSMKHIVFVFFIVSLFFPLIQQQFKLIKEKPLEGFFNIEDYPTLSIEKWKNGEFQKQFETAYNDQIGFHDFFIELQSQINYSLFNISKIQSVVVGKEGYLYVRNYIDAVNGNDFMGSAYINLQIEKGKVVDSILKQKNISLLFAIAPGKGSYFPEYIPDAYKTNNHPDSTNYACYKKAFANSSLNFLDLREYFLKIKDTCRYPLFSQVGVHWGEYACYIATDTLLKKLGIKNTAKIKDLKLNDSLIQTDKDAGLLMNTLKFPKYYKMTIPELIFASDTSKPTLNLLSIGDSYFSNIVTTGIVDSIFKTYDYKLYNKPVLSKAEFKKHIEKHQVVLLLATDATLNQFPYDFIDQAFETYAPKDKYYYFLKKREFMIFTKGALKNISKNKAWQKQMIRAAKQKNIKPEEEFVSNAIWLYYNQ